MDHTIQSLVYVIEQGAARVRTLGGRLQSASPNQLEPILRILGKEADTLSAGPVPSGRRCALAWSMIAAITLAPRNTSKDAGMI